MKALAIAIFEAENRTERSIWGGELAGLFLSQHLRTKTETKSVRGKVHVSLLLSMCQCWKRFNGPLIKAPPPARQHKQLSESISM